MVSDNYGLKRSDLWKTFVMASNDGLLSGFREKRWSGAEKWRGWLDQDALSDLSLEHSLILFRASGSRGIKAFNDNKVDDIRESLDFLLYDPVSLEGRFAECVARDGAYHCDGFNKELVTYLLCLKEPSLFGMWQPYVARALRMFGNCPVNFGKGHMGLAYLDLLDALTEVRHVTGLSDFISVDEYCYAITRQVRSIHNN